MIIPHTIKGRHKIRDAAICLRWKHWLDDESDIECITSDDFMKKLNKRFHLSEVRVYKILKNNHVLTIDGKYEEKAKRVYRLKRLLKKHPTQLGKKSTLDILEQLRKEIEGDRPLIDQSQHTHLLYNWQTNDRTQSRDSVLPSGIPERNPL